MTSKAERFAALLASDENAAPKDESGVDKQPKYRFCETAPIGMQFVPILAVSKFPYKYMPRSQSEIVSRQFFAGGKIWQRNWDLWYVWSPYYQAERPLIFVPLEQFKQLIHDIDLGFPSFMIRMPESPEGELIFPFEYSEDRMLRPHFLGHSSSKEEYERLTNVAPHFGPLQVQEPGKQCSYFKQDMEAAVDAGRTKGKAYKAKKQEARAVKQQDLIRQLERTKQSLHLVPSTSSNAEDDIVYISVDVESYERNHSIITEVGIATLDTHDLRNKEPDEIGKGWHQFIRARHFRINEYKHLKNGDFVRGCPESFEFGESEFVNIKDAPQSVASCFKPPYSDKTIKDLTTLEDKKRRLVLVGHDTKQDIGYLRDLGYDPTNLSNLIDFIDTAAIYRAATGENNTRGLSHILYKLDLEPWNLHNAGNDAVYTMQAMLGICVKHALGWTAQEEVQEEGGAPLSVSDATPEKKADAIDWGVLEATEKFEEWQM